MQISLRSHLIAGAAAVVGAGAFMAPVAQGHLTVPALAMPSSAQVALAAFGNPIVQLLGTADLTQTYLLAPYYNGGDAPTPGAGEANWPYAGFDQTGGDFLNYALYNEVSLGYYSFVGTAPQNILNASPVIRQLETNIAGYLNVGLGGLINAGVALSNGVWDYPQALVSAAQLALAGQFSEAVNVLVGAVVTPLQTAAGSLVTAGTYIVSNIAARLGAVVAALPQIVTTYAGAIAGTAALTTQKIAEIGQAFVSNLVALDFEGAWNTVVNGYLGPSGLPGLTLNLTIGSGVQTGPIVNPQTDIPTNFVPSFRTAQQAAVWNLATALNTQAAPVAAVAPAAPRTPAAAASRSAAKPAAAKSTKSPRAARAAKAEARAQAAG